MLCRPKSCGRPVVVTSYVAFGKAEAEAMTKASTEIAARAVLMIVPALAAAN